VKLIINEEMTMMKKMILWYYERMIDILLANDMAVKKVRRNDNDVWNVKSQ